MVVCPANSLILGVNMRGAGHGGWFRRKGKSTQWRSQLTYRASAGLTHSDSLAKVFGSWEQLACRHQGLSITITISLSTRGKIFWNFMKSAIPHIGHLQGPHHILPNPTHIHTSNAANMSSSMDLDAPVSMAGRQEAPPSGAT